MLDKTKSQQRYCYSSTYITAFNIDGLTIYKLLQSPVEHGHIPKYKQLSDYVLQVL